MVPIGIVEKSIQLREILQVQPIPNICGSAAEVGIRSGIDILLVGTLWKLMDAGDF
jgi:hypothetical protein